MGRKWGLDELLLPHSPKYEQNKNAASVNLDSTDQGVCALP